MGRVKKGDVFAIPDADYGNYYSIRCRGEDFSFFDISTAEILPIGDILENKSFLRLPVMLPSIKRAKWRKIGSIELTEPYSEYANYKHTPVGAAPLLYSTETGQSVQCDISDLVGLEVMAAWDAEFHIMPVLRYHFHRVETPFRHNVVAEL